MDNYRGGQTLENLTIFKNDLSHTRVCKNCEINKPIKNFTYKQASNNLYYIEYVCNTCKYINYKILNKDRIELYSINQKIKENFTIDGRAVMLRNRCRQRAKNYGMEFSLSKEVLITMLSTKKCSKTNIKLIIDDSKYNPYAPSIDRIDNNKGYTDENIQIVCMIYNFCRNSFSENQVEEFFNKLK